MKHQKDITRRAFLKNTALTSGFAALGAAGAQGHPATSQDITRLPREVWIAGVSQMGLKAASSEAMAGQLLNIMDKIKVFKPDFICLPEVFHTYNIEEKLSVSEQAGIAEKILPRFSDYARQNGCYLICPVITVENGRIYNAAVIYDRRGLRIGEYRKIHLTEGEMVMGLTPGPVTPPVFDTDHGKIGIQICFDLLWDDGWTKLREQGAEIVFWPSAYAGGQVVNAKAWQHKYVVATSTRKNTSKLCDITGAVIAQTGIWDANYYCAPVNLEKAFLHTWPYVRRFDEIREKYGRDVRITTFHEEEWSVIESLSPSVTVKNILEEFDLKTLEEHTRAAEIIQDKSRGTM